MNRTERLYAIVNELQLVAPRGRTAAWLADRFEVSTRTIKRDMRALHEANVGLVAEEGRGGGYSVVRNASVLHIGFTAAEAAALAVAIGAAPDLPYRTDGQSALAKILAAMTPEQRRATRDVAGRLWVREGPPRSRWARVVDEGLRRRVVMHLDYVDERGQLTRERPVEPMALVRTKHHWHLLAWCRLRDAGRWFRTDRVRAAWLTREPTVERDLTETFGPPPHDATPIELNA